MRLFEKTPEAMTGSRIAAVDYAKTLAIVCVVMIHVSSEILLGRQIGSAAWLEGLFWSSLARGAVPLFLMCSGVLFLDRSGGLSVRRIWKRNIPHILLALLVWAAVYKLVPRFLHESSLRKRCARFCWSCCAASMRAICIFCISCCWYMPRCRSHTRLRQMRMKNGALCAGLLDRIRRAPSDGQGPRTSPCVFRHFSAMAAYAGLGCDRLHLAGPFSDES